MSGFSATLRRMQASRLLSILMLLQTRGRISAQALAAELQVSVRTVYRDVDQLSAAGVPVWAETGRHGGFQLREGWRTQLTGLTTAEAQAVFLAGLPGPAKQLGLGEAMASAQLKLLAALPVGWQADAQRVSARFHLDPTDWYRQAAPADRLPAVAQAVWDSRRMAMRYESWKGVVEREVEPLGLVLKAGIWYVVARAGGKARTYRLDNILELTPSDERFEPPRGFDLAAYWSASIERFEAALYQDEATLRVSPRGLKWLRDFSAAVGEAALRTASAPESGGWVRVTVPIESVEHAADQLLRLGPEAEVLRPPMLRRRMIDQLQRMAALYPPPSRAGA
ncbi:YafY family transcriptional regulator [Schlegelella sp. S2-27]|uniref:YafY family transcriptional regulator n=1 Tax=Caldimonas mangrovi TaxID=2944811 RepID=A0ABT0YJM7_9BURK|nr:YafY family protein [Caldimonas mangrovi]MCM5678936.1 YafY family transcriptional regulator [Caldimonas mangrovi]